MALVAATTLGLGSLDRVRAQVSARPHSDGVEPGQGYRLIVQSYGGSLVECGPGGGAVSGGAGWLPGRDARPLASTQRAITKDELEKGVAVDVVSVGREAVRGSALVVAWVEPGAPDLEFDALEARPAPGAYYGVTELGASEPPRVQLVLDRRVG